MPACFVKMQEFAIEFCSLGVSGWCCRGGGSVVVVDMVFVSGHGMVVVSTVQSFKPLVVQGVLMHLPVLRNRVAQSHWIVA